MIWTSIQSLFIGMRYKSIGFQNLDIVASEITKFLLVNTGYESIQKLEQKVEILEKEKRDLITSTKGTVTASTSASNKVDELKKLLVGLDKRIQKLE